MDRSEAEAIYDAGREACVQFIVDLAARVVGLEERLERLEVRSRQDSRTSSRPPSTDPPKTRAERRAEARVKAKELRRRERERRAQGGQPGHEGAGRDLEPEDRVDEIVDHYPDACGGCGREFDSEQRRPRGRFGRHQVFELPPISGYGGIVISDRWSGYEHLDPQQRQVCWSHIKRDFRRHAEGLAEQKTFGEAGSALTRRVFAAWRAYQHDHHDRDQLKAEIAPIQTELRQLLENASPKSKRTRWHRRFANNLLKVWPALWTFVSIDGIEPTNNPAERALRSPVIHRKVSLGTQSEQGERFAERALSAVGTCRQQHRSLFTNLNELLLAHARGDPFPALA